VSTTLIFVELLSAGTLALIALCLAFVGLGGDTALLKQIADQAQVASVIIGLAIAYPLGIVVDGIADRVFDKIGKKYKKKFKLETHHSVLSLAANKDLWNEFAGKYFEYNRIRTRMVRSFLFNSTLMLAFGTLAGAQLGWTPRSFLLWIVAWAGLAAVSWE
jgi:hypothetical protein